MATNVFQFFIRLFIQRKDCFPTTSVIHHNKAKCNKPTHDWVNIYCQMGVTVAIRDINWKFYFNPFWVDLI